MTFLLYQAALAYSSCATLLSYRMLVIVRPGHAGLQYSHYSGFRDVCQTKRRPDRRLFHYGYYGRSLTYMCELSFSSSFGFGMKPTNLSTG